MAAASASCSGPPDGSAAAGNVTTEGTPATDVPLDEVEEDEEDAVATSRPAQRSSSEEAVAGADTADSAPAEADQPSPQAADTSTASSGTPAGGDAAGNTADDVADEEAIGTAGHPPVDTTEEAATGDAAGEPATAELTISPDVPDIEMIDLSSGSTVSLRSVVSGATPLLFWFWSPL